LHHLLAGSALWIEKFWPYRERMHLTTADVKRVKRCYVHVDEARVIYYVVKLQATWRMTRAQLQLFHARAYWSRRAAAQRRRRTALTAKLKEEAHKVHVHKEHKLELKKNAIRQGTYLVIEPAPRLNREAVHAINAHKKSKAIRMSIVRGKQRRMTRLADLRRRQSVAAANRLRGGAERAQAEWEKNKAQAKKPRVRGMMFIAEETPEDSEEGSLRSPEIDENLLAPLSPTGGGSNVPDETVDSDTDLVDGDAASATPVKAAPKKRGMFRKMGTRPLHSEAAMEKFEDKDE
jgi:hypothetical protein